jgi:hypothetical protein
LALPPEGSTNGGSSLKLVRTVFQDHDEHDSTGECIPKLVLLIDMEDHLEFSTVQMPNLAEKMNAALPGIFPDEDSPLAHNCGGKESGIAIHPFRDEVEKGTNIPHLLEHILLFLLSKRSKHCAGYCGQRSIDIEQGILTHYYIVMDYPSKVEAVVAVDLAMQLVTSWIEGKTVVVDRDVLITGLQDRLDPMFAVPMDPTESGLLAS